MYSQGLTSLRPSLIVNSTTFPSILRLMGPKNQWADGPMTDDIDMPSNRMLVDVKTNQAIHIATHLLL